MKVVAIGSDHAGFQLKEKVKSYLVEKNFEVIDYGADSTESTDYPDYAVKVAEYIRDHDNVRGILICGSGIGMSITANKVKGIRAALCTTPELAIASRNHNDANVLCMGERFIEPSLALQIVEAWFSANFEGGRHTRRINKISNYEEG